MALTNAQYDQVMRYYDERRTLHRIEADERLDEVTRAIPSYRDLLNEITACYTAIARDRLINEASPDPALAGRLSSLLKEKAALLHQNGFPDDYTEIRPDCSLCGDTGYVNGEKCSCFDRVVLSLFYKEYYLDRIPKEHDFEHFKTDLYSDTIGPEEDSPSPRAMAQEALNAARTCVGSKTSLLIYGQVGVGKTFLGEAILNEAAKTGHPGLYFSAREFFEILADAAFQRNDAALTTAALILKSDLLVIDDLGTELTNSYVESELFRVINERLRAGAVTVISTNLTPGELAGRYSERIFSRLMSGFRLVKLTGDDLRLKLRVR